MPKTTNKTHQDTITKLTMGNLFVEDNSSKYIIPTYQRNYAWGEAEINQLIRDINDYAISNDKDTDTDTDNYANGYDEDTDTSHYYIGTLVVKKMAKCPEDDNATDDNTTCYEVIDGQQRLTTLSLIFSYLKAKGMVEAGGSTLKVGFASRKKSHDTLKSIFDGENMDEYYMYEPTSAEGEAEEESLNSAIIEGYNIISDTLSGRLKDYAITLDKFAKFLLESVIIMRVEVPEDTDLNHYFEIMNTRGEQLEKHEILKARLLEKLADSKRKTAALIWDACANMDRYLQEGFAKGKVRKAVFGSSKRDYHRADNLSCSNFDKMHKALTGLMAGESSSDTQEDKGDEKKGNGNGNGNGNGIDDIIGRNKEEKPKGQGEQTNTPFKSIIDFPNFLLHVLRVHVDAEKGEGAGKSIPLDDKALIKAFETHLLKDGSQGDIERFFYTLFLCKYLFDKCIIKRDDSVDNARWSLKRFRSTSDDSSYENTFKDKAECKKEGDQESIRMLLSALHVSYPTHSHKHWLSATMKYLYDTEVGAKKNYIYSNEFLKHLKTLAKAFVFDNLLSDNRDYNDIVYDEGDLRCDATAEGAASAIDALKYGNTKGNLVFNYLDYLLWLKNESKGEKDEKISRFTFRVRNSVEHYYPQNPLDGNELGDRDALDSFGNLCLINRSQNSKLSNRLPNEKAGIYNGSNGSDILSLKQYVMMNNYEDWGVDEINQHAAKMKKLFLWGLTGEEA